MGSAKKTKFIFLFFSEMLFPAIHTYVQVGSDYIAKRGFLPRLFVLHAPQTCLFYSAVLYICRAGCKTQPQYIHMYVDLTYIPSTLL